MATEFLADLDELVLKCYSKESRSYIKEAIDCYRAGAFRACIVQTWIAVVFDFIHKLKELEISGDPQAKAELLVFEGMSTKPLNELKKISLEFEEKCLNLALNKFEIISHFESLDLDRLRNDRHRCAHPSLHSLDEIYHPTAEQARTHIRNAVFFMLAKPPVFGKSVLDKIIAIIESPSFPIDPQLARQRLESAYLQKPHSSLKRNFMLLLIKKIVFQNGSNPIISRYLIALKGFVENSSYTDLFHNLLLNEIQKRLNQETDECLDKVIILCGVFPEIHPLFNDITKNRLTKYIQNVCVDKVNSRFLSHAIRIKELKDDWKQKCLGLPVNVLRLIIKYNPELYQEIAIEKLATAESYDEANFISGILLPLVQPHIEKEHAIKLVRLFYRHSQVSDARDAKKWLNRYFNSDEGEIMRQEIKDDLANEYKAIVTARSFGTDSFMMEQFIKSHYEDSLTDFGLTKQTPQSQPDKGDSA